METQSNVGKIQIESKKEKGLLRKRIVEEFEEKEKTLTISQIKSKLKSPSHFMFIFGIERSFNSQLSSTTEALYILAFYNSSNIWKKEASKA